MITKPRVSVTINANPEGHDQYTGGSTLKPETRQLIKGIRGQHRAGHGIAKALGAAIGVEPSRGIYQRGSWVRRKTAQMQKLHKAKSGSKPRREFLKSFADLDD